VAVTQVSFKFDARRSEGESIKSMSVKAHIVGIFDQSAHEYGPYRIAFQLLAGQALRTPDQAAAAGQLLPLQLLEEGGLRCTEEGAELAAVHGHLHILQFLEERDTLTPRAALVLLHQATAGDSWKKRDCWCSGEPLHKWKCVTVRKGGMYVDLKSNCLAGVLPRSIGALGDQLLTLSSSHNSLAGPIPEAIGRLRSLRHLSLSNNLLEGPIPPSVGELSQLRDLHLDDNRLTGNVPDKLGHLTELEKLYLHHLRLSGEVRPRPYCLW
jgi:hypothetical protein